MVTDRNGLEVLGRSECLRLLAGSSLGRLGLSMGALPIVLPVNYALTDLGIVIRTGDGAKLDAALRNSVVAFEVDDIDLVYHTGWSVVVTGVARDLTDPAELERVAHLPIAHWSPGVADHFVAIPTDVVTGRRLATRMAS